MRQLGIALVWLWVTGMGASRISAQEPPGEAEVAATEPAIEAQAEARRLFERGRDALRSGRFAEAREHLDRSLALHPHGSTAFNLAVALRGTGEPDRALALFDALLAGAHGPLPGPQREEVERLARDVRAESGVLALRISGVPEAEVRVDGRPLGEARSGRVARWHVLPGEHRVEASADGERWVADTVRVEREETASLTLDLTAPPLPRTEDVGDGGLIASPWFWLAAGVAMIAAGVGAWLLLRGDGPGDGLVRDDVFGVTLTLR